MPAIVFSVLFHGMYSEKSFEKYVAGIWQQRANLMQGIWGNPGKSQTNGLKMADIAAMSVTIGKLSLLPKRFDQHVKPRPVSHWSVSGYEKPFLMVLRRRLQAKEPPGGLLCRGLIDR